MPRYTIPENPGRFRVVRGIAGNPIVLNDRTGNGQLIIPCQTTDEAEELCDRLNRGDHNGAIDVRPPKR